MSRERENEARRPIGEEDLLEWVLDERLQDELPRGELESDPDVAAKLEELESFLTSCRSQLAEEAELELEPTARTALVESILASTTREDLSWKGDLRLVGGFLRQRLRSSRLLRLVAASLLLHVIALPALAYYTLFVVPAQRTVIRYVPRETELPYAPDQLEPEREVREPLGTDLDALGLLRERLGRSLPGDGDRSSEGFAELDAELWGDSLGLVLWCEALMDDLEGPDPVEGRLRHLHFALGELEGLLDDSREREALRRLAASAWWRANRAGWAEDDARLLSVCRERLEGGAALSTEEWSRTYREVVGG